MKIGFIADCHIGNHGVMGGPITCGMNKRCHLILDALKRAVEVAQEKGCSHFVVVGDLFDTTKPLPQMIHSVQDIFKAAFEKTFFLLGNHEHASTTDGDNSLAPLSPIGEVIEKPVQWWFPGDPGVEIIFLPCVPEDAKLWFAPTIKHVVTRRTGYPRIMCFHLGVSDNLTPFYLQGAKDSIDSRTVLDVCKQHDIVAAFAGNWHNQRVWVRRIFQIGALAPTGFDNPGVNGYGGLAIFDSETHKTELVEIPGPRFLMVGQDGDMDELYKSDEAGHTVFARLESDPNEMVAIKEWGDELKDEGLIEEYTIRLNTAKQDKAAQEVAKKVRKASTLKEALMSFVDGMELPEDLSKDDVVKKAEYYLNFNE